MGKEKHRCCYTKTTGAWSSRQCKNAGKVEVRGHWYCGVHDPNKRERRDNKRNRLVIAEMNLTDARRDEHRAHSDIANAVLLQHIDNIPSWLKELVEKHKVARTKVTQAETELKRIEMEK